MNEFESELLDEMRALQPVAPSTRLVSAIDDALRLPAPRTVSPRIRFSLWASWSLTAAAAAAAAVAWWPSVVPPRTMASDVTPAPISNESPAPSRLVPVATSNVLTEARDEGIVTLDDGQAARRVRLHYVDTVQLRDDAARADIAVTRPREEIRYVPVNFY